MQLQDRTAVINEDNFNRLSQLYGELNSKELQRIVNNHIRVAIDEIMEDENGK